MGLAHVLEQNAMAFGRHPGQPFVRAAELFQDEFRANRFDDVVFRALDHQRGASDRRQRLLNGRDHPREFVQASDRHVSIIDLRMFGIRGAEREHALVSGDPFQDLIRPMHKRHEPHITITEFDRWRDRDNAGQADRCRSGVNQAQRASCRKSHHADPLAVGAQDLVAALERLQPVAPRTLAQIPG